MTRREISLALVVLVSITAIAERPERKVKDNILTSQHDPAIQIEVPKDARYLGASRWVLYQMDDCELHAFVTADKDKKVQKLYWIQFESYLPSHPEMHHQYDSKWHTTIAGMDFYVDTWVRNRTDTYEAGSDREHIESLIHEKGYDMPEGMMYVRLVHLLDPENRKELMIIYGEDLAGTGLSVGDLQTGGKAFDRWPEIGKALLQSAEQNVKIQPGQNP